MKIIIMGDIHADFGALNRFVNKKQPDIILQTGDFGWWPHRHLIERISRNHFFDQYAIKPGETTYALNRPHLPWGSLICDKSTKRDLYGALLTHY